MKLINLFVKNMGFVFYFTILLILILSGINPYDNFTWRLEVLWLFPALLVIAVLWFKDIKTCAARRMDERRIRIHPQSLRPHWSSSTRLLSRNTLS